MPKFGHYSFFKIGIKIIILQTKKPKVLRIINRLNLGGPTYNVAYLTKYLEDEFETLLITGMKDESEASSDFIVNQLGLKPHYIKHMYRSLHPLKDRKSLQEIRQIIRDFKPDIVHTHASKSGAVGRYAAIKENVPIIIHTFHGHIFHSYFNSLSTKIFLFIERYLAKRSTKIIAISKIQKAELCHQFKIAPEDKFEVIPLGFDLDRFQKNIEQKRAKFRTLYQLAENQVAIGIIGRLVPIKNHTLFVKSIKRLSEITNQKFRALIIGDGEEREAIIELCQNENLPFTLHTEANHNQLITFTSWIMEMDMATAGLDIIALTSLNEGTPVSLIEASAAGKPIVSTNVGGIEDVVKKDENAFVVERDDIEGFAQKLKLLVEDESLRKQMGENGVKHAFSEFSYTKLVENMRQLYKKLLAEKLS
jgi:glycosyltransferase involved in cell wall biosynthesis